eukprot:14583126-Alexandrium_andersonii.AAC.1
MEAVEDAGPPAAAAEDEDVLIVDQPAERTAGDTAARPKRFADDLRRESGLAASKVRKQGGRKSSVLAASKGWPAAALA